MNPAVAAVLAFFTQVFTKPFDAVVNYLRSNSVAAAYIMLTVSVVLCFINNILSELESVIAYSTPFYNREFQWATVGRNSGIDLLQIYAHASLAALVFVLLTNYFDKKNNNRISFTQGILLFSIAGIISDLIGVCANLIDLINVEFFTKLASLVNKFSYGFEIIVVVTLATLLVKDKNKLPLVYALAVTAGAFASMIINILFTL